MMNIIHECPHCKGQLAGWTPPAPVSYWTTTNAGKVWQKCPVCAGSGSVVLHASQSSAAGSVCPTCNGSRMVMTP